MLKVYCAYTPSHEALLRDWFLPSVPDGLEVVAMPLPVSGNGDFETRDFLVALRHKVDLILASVRDNPGDWIVWSDVDIVMFDGVVERLRQIIDTAGPEQILYQRETRTGSEVNAGFFLMRCGNAMEAFFTELRARLELAPELHEQRIANDMLAEGVPFAWGYLPLAFYARSHGWPPPHDLALYHANCTPGANGVAQKIRQFRTAQFYLGLPLPAAVKRQGARVVGKIRRMLLPA